MEYIASILNILGGIKGKKAAEEYAADEAKMEGVITQAKLEDLKVEERVLKGQTIAGAAGSGVKVDKGSPLEVLREQAESFTKERQTVARVGATRASNTLMRGAMAGRQALYQGWAAGLTQAASATKSLMAGF